jgi:hypothetical protein
VLAAETRGQRTLLERVVDGDLQRTQNRISYRSVAKSVQKKILT